MTIYDMTCQRSIWTAPSLWERVSNRPLQTAIYFLYHFFNRMHSFPPRPKDAVRLVCISDSHTLTKSLPFGDVLIHAGDLTNKGTVSEIQQAIDWLSGLPHGQKFVIAGNHDTFLDPQSRQTLTPEEQAETLNWKDIHYLQHSTQIIKSDSGRRLKIHGAPQIPRCGGPEFAFQYEKGVDAWSNTVPDDVDILVTHTPPQFHRDLSSPWLGCPFLLRETWRVQPPVHVFGHVHDGAGRIIVFWDAAQGRYEESMARSDHYGFLQQMLSARLWNDLMEVLFAGMVAILQSRLRRGQERRTIMLNAALMVESTGQLGNTVQVIDI